MLSKVLMAKSLHISGSDVRKTLKRLITNFHHMYLSNCEQKNDKHAYIQAQYHLALKNIIGHKY